MYNQQIFPEENTEDLIIKVMYCDMDDKDKVKVIKALTKEHFVPYADYPNPIAPVITYTKPEGATCRCSKQIE